MNWAISLEIQELPIGVFKGIRRGTAQGIKIIFWDFLRQLHCELLQELFYNLYNYLFGNSFWIFFSENYS